MVISVLAILLAMQKAAPVLDDIGAEPPMEQFIALAEPELLSKVPRVKDVVFTWPYRLVAGRAGYYTCGRLVTYEGHPPRKEIWVSAVVAHGKAVNVQWSTHNGMLEWDCKRNVRSGNLVPR